MKDFNVNTINTRQISRKWLLEMLSKEEQQMFKAFVKSLQSQVIDLYIIKDVSINLLTSFLFMCIFNSYRMFLERVRCEVIMGNYYSYKMLECDPKVIDCLTNNLNVKFDDRDWVEMLLS